MLQFRQHFIAEEAIFAAVKDQRRPGCRFNCHPDGRRDIERICAATDEQRDDAALVDVSIIWLNCSTDFKSD